MNDETDSRAKELLNDPGMRALLDFVAPPHRTITRYEGNRPIALRTTPSGERLTLCMLGNNITLPRRSWLSLLDDLKPATPLAGRVRDLLRDACD